jgi:hypothetical protein
MFSLKLMCPMNDDVLITFVDNVSLNVKFMLIVLCKAIVLLLRSLNSGSQEGGAWCTKVY